MKFKYVIVDDEPLARKLISSHASKIEGLEFYVDGNPSGTLMDRDEYTIYYVQATEEILSVDYLIHTN